MVFYEEKYFLLSNKYLQTRFMHNLNLHSHLYSKRCIYLDHMDRVKRIWYLSLMRAATVQASLRIRAVSPEPSLLAHTSSESRGTFRQKARSLAPLNGWACAVKVCHDGMLEDTNSLDGAHIMQHLEMFCQFMWNNRMSLFIFTDLHLLVSFCVVGGKWVVIVSFPENNIIFCYNRPTIQDVRYMPIYKYIMYFRRIFETAKLIEVLISNCTLFGCHNNTVFVLQNSIVI